MEALHDWLLRHGERLCFGQRRLAFAMTEEHRHGRLEWCEQHQGCLNCASVEDFWFEDEITITYGGHPKGKRSSSCTNRAVLAYGWASAQGGRGEGICAAWVLCTQFAVVWEMLSVLWPPQDWGPGARMVHNECCCHGATALSSCLRGSTPNSKPALTKILLPFLAAEGNTSVPHWHVSGQTPRHTKGFVSKGERKSLTIVVLIKYGMKPIAVPMDADWVRQAAGSGEKAAPLNTKSYMHIISTVLVRPTPLGKARGLRCSLGDVKLMHDRATPHTSKGFKEFARSNLAASLLLPVKGADLDPLDFGVFSNVKNAWLKFVQRGGVGWEEARQHMLTLLEEFNPNSVIKSLPRRIQTCIEVEGRHI